MRTIRTSKSRVNLRILFCEDYEKYAFKNREGLGCKKNLFFTIMNPAIFIWDVNTLDPNNSKKIVCLSVC